MPKIAIICNSLNPDLVLYFQKKVQSMSSDVVFFGNRELVSDLPIRTSSFSPSPRLSFWLLIDSFFSLFVLFQIILNNVKCVVFDTAHISNLPLAVLCKIFGVKLVFTIHDWNPHEGSQSKAVSLYNMAVKNYLGDEFIVFSPVEFHKPVHVLNLAGFDFKGSVNKSDYFLFFGRIEPYKGVKHLVSIANLLKKHNSKFRIVVAGKGEDPALFELSKLSNVNIINRFISEDELDNLIGSCISTILPYDSATQSGVAILSYSYSKPVIAFDVGSLGYYIEDGLTGYLVKHDSHDDFCDKMILANENYKTLSNNVCENFKKFDNDSLVHQYTNLIEQLH